MARPIASRSPSMTRWRRAFVVSFLLAALALLVPLADASPPDPTYLGGIWDDGDYDDVVIVATSSTAFTHGHLTIDFAAVPVVVPAPPPAPRRVRPNLRSTRFPPFPPARAS